MNKFISITFILVLTCLSCVDPIDFNIERGSIDQLVIDGRIVELLNEPNNYAEVNVQRVFNFESSSRSTVSVEEVTISNGQQIIELSQQTLGKYSATFDNAEYDLSDDKEHFLRVVDLLGRTYESDIVKKPSLAIPESIQIKQSSAMVANSLGGLVEEERAAIVINTPILAGPNNGLHWEATQTYQVNSVTPAKTCYVTENPVTDRVLLLNTEELEIERLDEYELFKTPITKRFREGIFFSVRQFSTDDATLNHLSNIQSLVTLTETIFNDPLNKLSSNISNVTNPEEEVFGHFYATQAYDVRIKQDSIRPYCNRTPPEGFDTIDDASCDERTGCPLSGMSADPLCCDCQKVPGSSIDRPSYWK